MLLCAEQRLERRDVGDLSRCLSILILLLQGRSPQLQDQSKSLVVRASFLASVKHRSFDAISYILLQVPTK